MRVEQEAEEPNQPGVLVVAAWRDHDGLRARITFTGRVEDEMHHSVVVAGREEIFHHIGRWLDDMASASDPDWS